MIQFKAVLVRVIKEIIRDKRTLALMLLAPILILTLMNLVFNSNTDTKLKLGVTTSVPHKIIQSLPNSKVSIHHYQNSHNHTQKIQAANLDAFVTRNKNKLEITYENEDPTKSAQVKSLFANALLASNIKELSATLKEMPLQPSTKRTSSNFKIKNSYLYGNSNSTFFDKIFPVLIGFFVFFFVFLISGIALIRERTSGTLDRLLATPIRRSQLVFGYLAGYGLFAILQTLLIVLFAIYILQVEIVGNLFLVLLTNILVALVALVIGLFVSTFANSEFQMMQFIPIIVVPQVFFSGIIPLDTMAHWVKFISYLLPLSYAGDALTNVMIKGQGLNAIAKDWLILLVFLVIFTFLNIVGLKRYRKV
ncbi:MAG: ABC transporter permease [Liquorilactobacillus sp.]|uniref:ABC transporter permease n=1 Tax=Liquorilactobacillus sp. TaxID=2767923 RepID=UPI0039ECE4AE